MLNEKYQGYFADCYILSNNRNKTFILNFLENFLPVREESADEYEVPQYGEKTDMIFSSALELIDFLIENPQESYAIYWRNLDKSDLSHAMCFFTNDGNIILGISTKTKYPNTEIEDNVFKKMQDYLSSEEGYITYEEPAPKNAAEFRKIIKTKHTTLW